MRRKVMVLFRLDYMLQDCDGRIMSGALSQELVELGLANGAVPGVNVSFGGRN